MIKYILYVLRWTVLAIPGALFFEWFIILTSIKNIYIAMIISQCLLGCIVFFIDRLIFKSKTIQEIWEIKIGKCSCGDEGKLRRLVRTEGYDKTDNIPIFLCKECSKKKLVELKKRGINATYMEV